MLRENMYAVLQYLAKLFLFSVKMFPLLSLQFAFNILCNIAKLLTEIETVISETCFYHSYWNTNQIRFKSAE